MLSDEMKDIGWVAGLCDCFEIDTLEGEIASSMSS